MASRSPAEDPYKVLGLSRGASSAEVKHAYRELSRRLHPDKDRQAPASVATARFQSLKAAYELLSDPVRRRALDSTVVSAPAWPTAAANKAAAPRAGKRSPAAPAAARGGRR